MKIKKGFVVREIAGKSVVIALGEVSKSFSGMIELNDTARMIWDMLVQGAQIGEITEAIVERYDADKDTVSVDVERFVASLGEAGILE